MTMQQGGDGLLICKVGLKMNVCRFDAKIGTSIAEFCTVAIWAKANSIRQFGAAEFGLRELVSHQEFSCHHWLHVSGMDGRFQDQRIGLLHT